MAQIVEWRDYALTTLAILKDNYVYVISRKNHAEVTLIDGGEAPPVLRWCEERLLKISQIVATHHHHDHIDGISELKARFNARVLSSSYDQSRITGVDQGLVHEETFSILGLRAQALMIPGHTLGHMAIYVSEPGWLFSGDTWFGLGCGRLFEGTAEQLRESLNRLAQLPPETKIFCGHEYTLRNADFALGLEPGNQNLKARQRRDLERRAVGAATIPFTIGEELLTNPFLRTQSSEIRNSLGFDSNSPDAEIFRELRLRRNSF